MSTTRIQYETVFEQFVGETRTFEITVKDPDTGGALNLSDTTTYATARVKITKPNGTIIATLAANYSDRNNGKVTYTVDDTIATEANAGNWMGLLELLNSTPKIITKQRFNHNILESK